MLAAWYERQGGAAEVLQIGEFPAPEPGPGEVGVRIRFSGVNPGDTKKRRGFYGSPMPFPQVIPHSDGAGVIDGVGAGVDPARVGRRVYGPVLPALWHGRPADRGARPAGHRPPRRRCRRGRRLPEQHR